MGYQDFLGLDYQFRKNMSELQSIKFIERKVFWRIQSTKDIQKGDLSTIEMEGLYQTIWLSEEGEVINVLPGGGSIILSLADNPDLSPAFYAIAQRLQQKLDSLNESD
jgi:hypothetical protein